MEELKTKLQQHMQLVWELSALDEESLSDEDQALAEIMQMHPEYYDLWDRLGDVTDDEQVQVDTDPILHILLHQIVENQLASLSPPESTETLDQLLQQGLSRHEAIHQIGEVFGDKMLGVEEANRNFDDQRYVQSLRQLIRPRRRRRRRRP